MHRSRTLARPAIAVAVLLLAGCTEAEETADRAPAIDTAAAAASAADTQAVRVADAGLQGPESMLHDPDADVYLVSNINGSPVDADDNGFISRVRPDGSVEELRWIDGAAGSGVTLSAPKGMALKGDTLFVTDIDSVRAFSRTTGEPLGARGVPGASFLNDLAVGPGGALYVTDTGVNADFSSAGTEAVYRFDDGGSPVVVAEGVELAGPNGIVVEGDAVVLAPFATADLLRIPLNGDSASTIATLPGGQLDGVVRTEAGDYLVSSWETSSVYRVPTAGGQSQAVVEDVPSPADIGWDAQRQRVLIPLLNENRLEIRPVGRQ